MLWLLQVFLRHEATCTLWERVNQLGLRKRFGACVWNFVSTSKPLITTVWSVFATLLFFSGSFIKCLPCAPLNSENMHTSVLYKQTKSSFYICKLVPTKIRESELHPCPSFHQMKSLIQILLLPQLNGFSQLTETLTFTLSTFVGGTRFIYNSTPISFSQDC